MPHPEPTVRLELGEYELQVLETIGRHAIDEGALSDELYGVVSTLLAKVKDGRAKLKIQRRRLALQHSQENNGQPPTATVSNPRPRPGAGNSPDDEVVDG